VAITLGVSCLEAQVTIGGEETAAGTLLSLNSTMKGGLILSNVKLKIVTEIPLDFPGITPENQNTEQTKKGFTGSVVYNINGSFGQGRGVYSWDGEKWIYIGGGLGYPTGRLAYRIGDEGPIDGWVEFMTYNLGATPMTIDQQMAHSYTYPTPTYTISYIGNEAAATPYKTIFGDLYQWGRKTDGHEKIWSGTSPGTVSVTDFDNAGDKFMTGPGDWLPGSTGSSKPGRWGSVDPDTPPSTINYKGVNDPCPEGFNVPSLRDWKSISFGANSSVDHIIYLKGVNKWKWHDGATTNTVSGWLVYPLKSGVIPENNITMTDEDYEDEPTLFLPLTAGVRLYDTGFVRISHEDGGSSYYWSSTSVGYLKFNSTSVNFINGGGRPAKYGNSVRCMAESKIPAN
jgi:uncharacterized protein (TIGR02145 family)